MNAFKHINRHGLALSRLALSCLALCALTHTAAWSQASPKPAAKPAKAAPAKPAPAAVALPSAGPEQMTAATLAHIGSYDCEFGEIVTVNDTPQHPGYLDVHHKKTAYTMKAVLSSTGVVRLEDVRGRMLMLQIANKSMLMDAVAGQRVVDGCVHEKQRAAASAPPAQSLGIEPPKPAASAPA